MAKTVTLYIEDTEIKVLVVSGNKVEKWASLMLEEGLVEQGVILDEKKVSAAIQQLFKLQGLHQHSVTVGLSGLNSIFRIITLPKVAGSLLAEAISNEASRVLPVPLSQVYYSYQQLPGAKEELRFFLAAYPRETTDALLGTIHKAGLKTDLLDLAPLALARFASAAQAILVNSWLSLLDIVIMVERVPQVIRSVLLPVEGSSSQERLSSIAEELSRTITFYNSSNPDKPLDKAVPVYVCGDLAGQDDGLTYLTKLGFPVSRAKTTVEFKEPFFPTHYAVNIGLALKGTKPGHDAPHSSLIDFNALPQAYRPPPFSPVRVLIPVGSVIALTALGYGWLMVQDVKQHTSTITGQSASIQVENARLRATIKRTKDSISARTTASAAIPGQASSVNQSIADAQNTMASYNDFLSGLQKALAESNADLLKAIALLPAEIRLEEVSADTSTITLTGLASSEGQVLAYAKVLLGSGRFAGVMVESMSRVDVPEVSSGKVVEFTLNLS
jgi:type IV pilus assembly protein PilM